MTVIDFEATHGLGIVAAALVVMGWLWCNWRHPKLTWQRSLPAQSAVSIAAYCILVLIVVKISDEGGAVTSSADVFMAGLPALMDVPLYVQAWTAAQGTHPVASFRTFLKETKRTDFVVLGIICFCACVRLVLAVVLRAAKSFTEGADQQAGWPSSAPATIENVVALCCSLPALAAVLFLAAVYPWRRVAPHFRCVRVCGLAGMCACFLGPACEVVAQAATLKKWNLTDAEGGDESGGWRVSAFGVLLPRLLSAVAGLATYEYLITAAARAGEHLRDSIFGPRRGAGRGGSGTLAKAGSARSGRLDGAGACGGVRPSLASVDSPRSPAGSASSSDLVEQLAQSRDSAISVVNPVTELELATGAWGRGGDGGTGGAGGGASAAEGYLGGQPSRGMAGVAGSGRPHEDSGAGRGGGGLLARLGGAFAARPARGHGAAADAHGKADAATIDTGTEPDEESLRAVMAQLAAQGRPGWGSDPSAAAVSDWGTSLAGR